MIDESRAAEAGALSPRAGVALLTLQLRSTLQEAVDAEAEVASVDVDASLWQLRSRLGPLMEDRRRALDADLVAEQEQADASVAAARAEAAQIVADAYSRADAAAVERAARVEAAQRSEVAQRAAAALAERQAAIAAAALLAIEPPVIESPVVENPVVKTPTIAKPDLFDDPLLDWQPKVAPATLPPPLPPTFQPLPTIIEATNDTSEEPGFDPPVLDPSVGSAPLIAAWIAEAATEADECGWVAEPPAPTLVLPVAVTNAPVGSADPQAMHVMIDADSFAKAFAAALAPVLDACHQAPQYPPQAYTPAPAPAPKKSFWAHAWHPDVLLSGLAMVIVIIVLIAWTG